MQRFEDCFENVVYLQQHIGVPESENAKAARPEKRISASIIWRLLDVLAAVQLDNEIHIEANEVADVITDLMLSPELEEVPSSYEGGGVIDAKWRL